MMYDFYVEVGKLLTRAVEEKVLTQKQAEDLREPIEQFHLPDEDEVFVPERLVIPFQRYVTWTQCVGPMQ